MIESYRYDS